MNIISLELSILCIIQILLPCFLLEIETVFSLLLSCPDPRHYRGEVVSPSAPRVESGIYWGYNVRFAHSFGAVFTESPYVVHTHY